MGTLFRLVYVSHTDLDISVELLDRTSHAWKARNAEAGITGALMFCAGYVVHALEGDEATVRDLFATICRDWRHTDVQLIRAESVEKRLFVGWAGTAVHVHGLPIDFYVVRQLTALLHEALHDGNCLSRQAKALVHAFQQAIVRGYGLCEPSRPSLVA